MKKLRYKILRIKGHDIKLDVEDWLRLCGYKWRTRHNGQVGSYTSMPVYFCVNKNINRKNCTIYMHRAIMSPPYGLDLPTDQEVHHVNGYFDMRKQSLEVWDKSTHSKITRNGNEHLPERPDDGVPI